MVIAAVFLGCAREDGGLSARFKGSNLLLISVDTLRADHLGCYGYDKKTSYIDSIADRSFVFTSMFTTSSTTLPAHISLLTGLYPRDSRNGYHVQDSVTTLAELLSENGYSCSAFVSALPLDVRFNLDQGFSYYDSDFSGCEGSVRLKDQKWYDHSYQVFDCNAQEINQKVIAHLSKSNNSSPYFLWVHYYDPHFPYRPPLQHYDSNKVTRTVFPFYFDPTKSDRESLNELYDGEIRFVDQQLEVLINGLKELKAYDNTIVVIVSDHGENLYEHDRYLDHSNVVYETVMWIPCILYLPGWQGRTIDELTSSIDVMPTVLDLLGITPVKCDGRSLRGIMEGGQEIPVRNYVSCVTNDFGVKDEQQTVAVRTRTMKYIYNVWNQKIDLFFDVQKDPHEKEPLGNGSESRKKELISFYQEWCTQYKTGQMASRATLDKGTKEALQSLGYVQ